MAYQMVQENPRYGPGEITGHRSVPSDESDARSASRGRVQ